MTVMAVIPRLVGAQEIGRMLNVNRQRVNQLSALLDFPKPVAVLAMGKVWISDDIESWAGVRGRTIAVSGRPAWMHATHHHSHEYKLTCEQYEELIAHSHGACALCRTPWTDIVGKGQVDHDHSVTEFWAFRGLVCPQCNAHMRRVDSGERSGDDGATRRYLENAWFKTRSP